MQALFQVSVLKAGKLFKRLSIFTVKSLLHVLKNPLKSGILLIKFYVTLMLLAFFLTASFSSFAHEVDANQSTDGLITSPVMSPLDIRGRPMSEAKSALIDGYTAGNMSSVTCTQTGSTTNSINFTCDMINGYSGLPRTDNPTVKSSTPITFTCPPSGYSDHTVLNGTYCNTPTGTHPTDPEEPDPTPEPTLPTINCSSLAGSAADFAAFTSPTQLTPEQRDEAQCSDNPDGNKQYKNSCHVIGGAGWLENETYDEDGNPDGYSYTHINGTFSGFACDEDGEPTANDESCTAFDNGLLKKVTCPDGTSMTVDWAAYLATHEAFLNNRADTQTELNAVNNRVDNVENLIVTTDEIVIALSEDEAFKESVKGEQGEPCTAQRLPNNAHLTIFCGDSNAVLVDGTKGATGEKGLDGEKGEDGESCVAIATTGGVNVVCKDSTSFLAKGTDGEAGEDGEDCSVSTLGTTTTVTCGATSSTIEGVDEGGIVTAIQEQTNTLTGLLTYEGDTPSVDFSNSEPLNSALGTANDYEVRNYGTVIEGAVNQMKESEVFVAVDGFFAVSFNGSCPSYTANVDFMNTSVTMDHWCRPIMNEIWPMIQAIVIFGFSFMAFRVAIL